MPYKKKRSKDRAKKYADIIISQKITMNDIKEHMTGPTLSVILHIILLGLLGSIIVYKPPPPKKYITVKIKAIKSSILEKKDVGEEGKKAHLDTKTEANDTQKKSTSTPHSKDSNKSDQKTTQEADMMSIQQNNSKLILSGIFALRGEAARSEAIKKYGGSSKTEGAVNKGLKWLAEHQNPDGSWGEYKYTRVALTSLALLAFLGHGETPQSPKYGKTVLKAIHKCVNFSEASSYGWAMLTYAACEAYAITKIPALKSFMNKMLRSIIKGMNSLGSYNYYYNNTLQKKTGTPRCDLSFAGWNYQALKAGLAANATTEGLQKAIQKAIICLKTVSHYPKGGFVYTPGNTPTETMTAVGVLCLELFGEKDAKETRSGLKLLEKATIANMPPLTLHWDCGPTFPLYCWYYKTQAIFHGHNGEGEIWHTWNKNMKKELLKHQKNDGHWPTPGQTFLTANSTELDKHIYATSLCVLILEVYYRYLPSSNVLHKENTASLKKRHDNDEDDDNLNIKWE